MAKIEILVCDICGEPLPTKPELGDQQGGPVDIVFPAYTQRMVLCAKHMQELDKYRQVGERVLSGTLPTREAIHHLPVAD